MTQKSQINPQLASALMKKPLILFLLLFACHNDKIESYTVGFPIEHTKGAFLTTKKQFDLFYLHSWMHDTLYRHCGQEIIIEPKDSSMTFDISVSGADLIRFAYNDYRYTLDPTDSIVNVTIKIDGKEEVKSTFIAPELPFPEIRSRIIGDTIILNAEQNNKRIKGILPKDSRYYFKVGEEYIEEMRTTAQIYEAQNFKLMRYNYRNRIIPVN